MVETLGLGDSLAVRLGLARVIRVALQVAEQAGGMLEVRHAAADLERGA